MNKLLNCDCGNIGFYVIGNYFTGDQEQEQCEFCYTEPDSVFNNIERRDKEIADLKERSIKRYCKINAYLAEIADLKDQLGLLQIHSDHTETLLKSCETALSDREHKKEFKS